MENREALRKRSGMKTRFVVSRFLIYFCIFTLPVILLGVSFSYRMYHTFTKEMSERRDNSLRLFQDQLESCAADIKALNMYIENGNQTLYFLKMFSEEAVDYATNITMRHLSGYLASLGSSKESIDSVYFYMENQLGRVLTSEGLVTDRNSMYDQQWWLEFDDMAPGEIRMVTRTLNKHIRLQPKQVLSVFHRFQNYRGGTVINFEVDKMEQLMDRMVFYDGQTLACMSAAGEVLLANEAFNRNGGTNDNVHVQEFAPYGFRLITAIPEKTVLSYLYVNMQAIILIIAVTILSSIVLSYYHAIRSYKQLYSIIEIFDRAETGQEIGAGEIKEHDIYSQILNSIVQTFIKNSYLNMQLSERKYKQMAAELMALQYQINPHFLFNTLQAINYEILDVTHGQRTQANRMLEYLSDILRYSLSSPDDKITLKAEVENSKKYIEIQQARHSGKFHVEWDYDESLCDILMERLLLQPIIENAISHGLKNKADPAILRIRIRKKGNKVRFTVIDNGDGISPEILLQLKKSIFEAEEVFTAKHIGLKNINQRLLLAYSPESRLHIWSRPGLGTLIYFEIPTVLAE